MNIKSLKFYLTCSACPEQYDVEDKDGNMVGYVRLRWGVLSCEYPDVGGEEIYYASIGDSWTGSFEDDEQRMFHLNAIADKILERIGKGDIEDEDEMTYEEVIEIVKDLDPRGYPTYRKAKELAVVACEKQIPKLVVCDGDDESDFVRCPYCNGYIGSNEMVWLDFYERGWSPMHCQECGQAIVWE